jgi:hypothetical protein
MARRLMQISLDAEIMERVRDCSACTGYPISRIAEMGLIGELAKLESQYGKFPARPRKRLVGGNPPGWNSPGVAGRRAPMVAEAER